MERRSYGMYEYSTESTYTRVRQRLFFEGLDRLIRFVCGASWPGWYLCLLSLTAASSLSTRARRGKKAMHGNSVIEFAGSAVTFCDSRL